MKIGVVVGNPKKNSRTLEAAVLLAQQIEGELDYVLDLADLGANLLEFWKRSGRTVHRRGFGQRPYDLCQPDLQGDQSGTDQVVPRPDAAKLSETDAGDSDDAECRTMPCLGTRPAVETGLGRIRRSNCPSGFLPSGVRVFRNDRVFRLRRKGFSNCSGRPSQIAKLPGSAVPQYPSGRQ